MRRVTRKVENTKPARRTTKNEGSDARVKAELINLVKDGTVTWEELARACVYWMDNDAAWSVVAELGEGADDDYDDDMIDDSQDAEDFDMPDWDAADAEDEDDVEMDECDQSRRSALESRIRRLEGAARKMNRRTIKNEDVKRLPDGSVANRVSDVLAAWAGTSWSRPQDAIRELDRQGILDAAVNKWYPTADDVAAAVEDCWDDNIGMVGQGAAQFFIGNVGGETKCSLTLLPILGGTSRARNVVLKFTWPEM